MANLTQLKGVVLLDIEGTTTSISFVKDVLFPYARNNLVQFLTEHWSDPEILEIIQQIKAQCDTDIQNGIPDVPPVHCHLMDQSGDALDSVVKNVLWQMDQDRKTTGLKALQGKIWKSGFDSGDLRSHIFPDVHGALRHWTTSSRKVYIYSSGSIDAQKLLFAHTEVGNLSHLLNGYFDTTTGPKVESQSYARIADQIGESPENITFFTDSLQEADAATKAGLQVIVTIRPGNPVVDIDKNKYHTTTTFNELDLY